MNKLFVVCFCLMSVGCVHRYDVRSSRNGMVVSRTQGAVGYRSSESQTEMNDTLMPTCLAHVGQMPNGEQEALCAEKTRATIEQETYPYGTYGSYGYGSNPYGYYAPAYGTRPYP